MLNQALSLLLRATAARELKAAVVRSLLTIAAAVLSALCCLAALGCLLAALWIYVAGRLGPVEAPLTVALVLLILAGLLALTMRRRRRRPRPASERGAGLGVLPSSGPLHDLLRENETALLVAAALAGLLLGADRRDRRR